MTYQVTSKTKLPTIGGGEEEIQLPLAPPPHYPGINYYHNCHYETKYQIISGEPSICRLGLLRTPPPPPPTKI